MGKVVSIVPVGEAQVGSVTIAFGAGAAGVISMVIVVVNPQTPVFGVNV